MAKIKKNKSSKNESHNSTGYNNTNDIEENKVAMLLEIPGQATYVTRDNELISEDDEK